MKVVEDKGTLRSEPTMGLGSFYEHTTDPQYKESRSYQKTVQKLKRKKYSGADTSSSGSGSDIDSAGGRSSGCEEDGTAVRHTAEPTHRKKATATIDRNKLSRKKSLSSENAKVPNRKDRGYQPRPCTGSVLTCTKAFCFACECGKPRN
ncbi:hypothetical protein SARC_07368 [Sphaeroforma arctica JP610]|uniref:Uncharacterized protein n=1 Tax=Sphaeroforma arctica JP610 TaxID=667725 RepID=A0A0L0FUE4_9EUKA|nr:hypothetical protein SARC_07368 [Sphaeroforma arctica JP610]KNC80274.1 hypothetical protein SARC_07368 [Sphaeroforma arctica JP610]|eukprot:XP_014154176.1 hypothetical protein SARC_07368 [Sphaeroforma arctica JP610]